MQINHYENNYPAKKMSQPMPFNHLPFSMNRNNL